MNDRQMSLLVQIAERPGITFAYTGNTHDHSVSLDLLALCDEGAIDVGDPLDGYKATPKGLDLVTDFQQSSDSAPLTDVVLDRVTRFMMVLIMRHLPVLTTSNATLEAREMPLEAMDDITGGIAKELARALLG
jgi:hypothetical protein